MSKSKIEWCEAVYNPVVGCSKLSDGCLNCYAEKMHKRLQAMGLEKYKEPFNKVRLYDPSLSIPSKTKKPTVFFVNSMSDLFHSDLKEKDLQKVFKEINNNPRHIFLVLTKRPLNIISCNLHWPENIWLGVTIESNKYIHRVETLQKIPARHKFISFEPLLDNAVSHILLPKDIEWVIVGGESGPNAREMKREWVDNIFREAVNRNMPFFFKQWGSYKNSQHWITDKLYTNYLSYKQFPSEIEKLMEAKKKKSPIK